jgi:branched-chain amino acid transport system permease protein
MVQGLSKQVEKLGLPSWVWGAGFLALLLLLRPVLSDFNLLLVSQMLIIGLFALSLNLIMGYGGMVSFGHAAFYGLGGYTVAILITRYQVPFLPAMALAPLVSAAVAVVIGWFCVRRVQLYFSILTLAFSQLIYVIVFQAREFTGGDDGIQGIPVPAWLAVAGNYYLFTVLVFVLCFLALWILTNSSFVLTLRAIRENPERALFIGVNVRRHQLITFVIGAFFAGIAGAMMVALNHFVGPEMLYWTTGAEPILASLLGGMFSLIGPAIGAAILTFLDVTITRFTAFWPMVLGILTITAVLVAPTGLVGLAERWRRPRTEE